ncbi:MAG: FixH family protein [Pseudomonadota bacterium]
MNESTHNEQGEPPRPWYRQFWPWFVFGLPALSVAAGIVTIFLAVSNPEEILEQDQGTSSTDLGSATGALEPPRTSVTPT